MKRSIIFLILALILSSTILVNVYAQEDGTESTELAYLQLSKITYGNNMFIAVGEKGVIIKSSDGLSWVKCRSGIKNDLYGVVYGQKQFIAMGTAGMILKSSDGENWAKANSGINCVLYDGIWDGQKFVLVGQNGVIITSSDGLTWKKQNSGISDTIPCIAWNGKEFITGGVDRLTSNDGLLWTPLNDNITPSVRGITWWKDNFWVVTAYGTILRSPDGKTWTKVFSSSKYSDQCNAMCSNENTIIAIGSGVLLISTNGTKWSSEYLFDSMSYIRSMTWGQGKFVGVGNGSKTATSLDGKEWTEDFIQPSATVGNAVEEETKSTQAILKTSPEKDGILYLTEQDDIRLYLEPGFDISDTWSEQVTILDEEGTDVFDTYGYIGGIDTINTKNTKGLVISLIGKFELEETYSVNIKEGFLKDDAGNVNQPYSFNFTVKEINKNETAMAESDSGDYHDVSPMHWAYNAIKEISDKGIISGYPDRTFKPDNYVTRSEFAKMMVLALDLAIIKPVDPTFCDVQEESWDYGYVEATRQYLNSYKLEGKNYFKGSERATREDVAAAIVKAMHIENQKVGGIVADTFKDIDGMDPEMKNYVLIAYRNGMINGYDDGTFRPKEKLTRAEAVSLLYRLINK